MKRPVSFLIILMLFSINGVLALRIEVQQSMDYVDISRYRSLCGDETCKLVALTCGSSFDNPYVIPQKNFNIFTRKLRLMCEQKTGEYDQNVHVGEVRAVITYPKSGGNDNDKVTPNETELSDNSKLRQAAENYSDGRIDRHTASALAGIEAQKGAKPSTLLERQMADRDARIASIADDHAVPQKTRVKKGIKFGDDSGTEIDWDRPYVNPEQRRREKLKSQKAYLAAMTALQNFESNKKRLEIQIDELTIKNHNGRELISILQKDSVRFHYMETVVWYSATNYGSKAEEAVVTNLEKDLKNIFGFSDEEIRDMETEALTTLKKGAPTLTQMEFDDIVSTREGSVIVTDAGRSRVMDTVGTGLTTINITTPITAGIIEKAYADSKKMISETIEQFRVISTRQINLIALKHKDINRLTEERDHLLRVFDKYGYDIIDAKDDNDLILFGIECREALIEVIE